MLCRTGGKEELSHAKARAPWAIYKNATAAIQCSVAGKLLPLYIIWCIPRYRNVLYKN